MTEKKNINKMDFLIGLYVFAIFASEVMGIKSFPLFNIFGHQLNASVAIFLLPIIYSINDVVIEVYGKERMRQIMKLGFLIIFMIALTSAIFTWLPETERFKPTSEAYNTIFHTSIRMSIASLISFAIANILDILIFAKLREKMKNKGLWFRTNISNIISECFDTFIFLFLAFYVSSISFGDNLSFILSIGFPYWLLKCIMSFVNTPFVYLGVKYLKNNK